MSSDTPTTNGKPNTSAAEHKPSPGFWQRLQSLPAARQFMRFFWSGLFATGCHYALMIWLVELGLRPMWLATSIGFAVSAVLNFLLARFLVFSSDAPWLHAGLRYLIMIGGGLLLNAVVFYFLAQHMFYIAAQVGATATVFIYNFFISKFWVHR
ncbi:GtrA family protein [Agaribacterium haliotis]|uniref:GtrA family protein n=1 Tax=Agaribacterium haliotis TaxID=2013869 RepID=UPI000BB5408F|nr:GtrA family protein [Agaribacterium haliotis]